MMCTSMKMEARAALARVAAAMATAMRASMARKSGAIMYPMKNVQISMLQHVAQRVHVYLRVHEGEHDEWCMAVQEKSRRTRRYHARDRARRPASARRRRRTERATDRDAHLCMQAIR